jgi:hypothetical protein
MARYYFNVEGGYAANDDSIDVPTLAEAKCEAVRYAGRLLCDRAGEFWDSGDFTMTVTDEHALTLFSLQFSAVEAPAVRVSR